MELLPYLHHIKPKEAFWWMGPGASCSCSGIRHRRASRPPMEYTPPSKVISRWIFYLLNNIKVNISAAEYSSGCILHQLSHIKVNIPATEWYQAHALLDIKSQPCQCTSWSSKIIFNKKKFHIFLKINLASVPVGPFPLYSIVVICNPGLRKNKKVIIYYLESNFKKDMRLESLFCNYSSPWGTLRHCLWSLRHIRASSCAPWGQSGANRLSLLAWEFVKRNTQRIAE